MTWDVSGAVMELENFLQTIGLKFHKNAGQVLKETVIKHGIDVSGLEQKPTPLLELGDASVGCFEERIQCPVCLQ